MFRSENTRLVRKYGDRSEPRRSSGCSKTPNPQPESMVSLPLLSRMSSTSSTALLNQAALAFFTSRYVIQSTSIQDEPDGYLQCLPPLLLNTAADSALSHAASAAAISTLSKERHDAHMLERARSHYAAALTKVKSDLAEPTKKFHDETLMAIHALGLYETVTTTTDDLTAWANHLRGAATLIRIRDTAMFESPTGASLFYLHRGILTIFAIESRRNLFPFLKDLNTVGSRHNTQSSQGFQSVLQIPGLLETFDRLVEQYSGQDYQIRGLWLVITLAADLDAELDCWLESLPSHWKTIRVVRAEIAKHNDPHLPAPMLADATGTMTAEKHSTMWITSTINFVRCCRMKLQALCIEGYSILSSVDSGPTQYSRRVLKEQVDRICATVACVLGCDLMEPANFTDEIARSHARALGGYSLLWPLSNVLRVDGDILHSQQRSWAAAWLKYIMEARDIGQLNYAD